MPKFEVTEELVYERIVQVEAEDQSAAERLVIDVGEGEEVLRFQSTYPTLVSIVEIEDESRSEDAREPDVQTASERYEEFQNTLNELLE